MFAEIIINSNAKALNRIFDYMVPEEMINNIRIGARVFVPFGNGKKIEDGFVINLKDNSEFANKEIIKIVEEESLTEENIILAKLMARKYFCNISDCIKLMLPPGTGGKVVENRIKEKKGNFVFLKQDEQEILEQIENEKIKSEKHIRVLKFLIGNDGIYLPDLELITDVSKSIIQTMKKKCFLEIVKKQIEIKQFINKNIEKDEPKKLTEEQKKCFDSISFCIENEEFSKHLIYGVTGSGKTEIYLQ